MDSIQTPTRTQMVEYHESRIAHLEGEITKFRNAAWAFEAMADAVKTLPVGPGFWTQAVQHMSKVALDNAAVFTDLQRNAEVEAARLREEGVPS
mgnify:CR=1 FL=1